MKKYLFLLVLLPLLLTGCASVTVTKITSENPYKEGVRFYRPWPYLLVTKGENGKLEAKTIYLPRINEEYCIKVNSGMGTVDSSFTLTDGWQLTVMGDKRDSKVPETIDSLAGVLAKVAPGGLLTLMQGTAGGKEPTGSVKPGLYRYDIDENSGFVTGFKEVCIFTDKKK